MEPAVPPDSVTDEQVAARALRSKGRRMLIMVGANVLLLVLMVGGPYLRGHLRTRSLWPHFAEAAACVLGGRPRSDPGLGLPRGADARFAERVIADEPDWPGRCEARLSALALPPATFLLPEVKTAELDLDATVDLVKRELALLSQRPAGTRIPTRPLRALEKLRVALARHAQAAGLLHVPDGDAIAFDRSDAQVEAARVPLYASADAEVLWHGTDQAVSILALDRRGLSFIEVGDGGLTERRDSRPATLRGVVPADSASRSGWHTGNTLVWAMRPSACDARDGGCVRKAAGVAPLRLPFEGLPDPLWVASHPAGRIDRSVRRAGDSVRVLAPTDTGRLQVREFEFAAQRPETRAEGPCEPAFSWPELEAEAGAFVGTGEAVVGSASEQGGDATFFYQARGEPPRRLAQLSGDTPWALACPARQAGALGTGSHAQLWWRAESGELRLSKVTRVPLTRVVHDEQPARDRARLLCGEGPPLLVVRAADDVLALVACGPERCDKRALAEDVRFFDAVRLGDALLVAFAGSGAWAQVRTRTLALPDGALGEPVVPNPCWQGGGGLCGMPRLLVAGDRVLLGTREGTDMRLVQSADRGRHWTPMDGLRKAAGL